ncbi:hypothetical protein ACIQZI_22475 [Peribacillus sp. NPDC096379]|uniref:hypothetical protein n=1 Tax=Peribacillus sp. NPDC096379 TaxID=3364393 RepID=UPI00381C2F35
MFRTAKQIICGVEVMQMLKKGQPQQGVKSVQSEVEFTNKKTPSYLILGTIPELNMKVFLYVSFYGQP